MAAPHRRKDARLDLGRKPAPLTLIMLAGRGDVAAGGSRQDGAELRRRIQRCAGSGPAGAAAARAAGAAAARPAGLGLHQRARAARSAGSEELGEGLGAAPPRRCRRRHPPLPPPAELSGSGGAAEPPPAPSLQGGVTPRP